MFKFLKKIPVLRRLAYHLESWAQARRNQRRLKKTVRNGGALKLVVGSSGIFELGWIETDMEYLNLLKPEHWSRQFDPESIDAILAEHVWEHLTLNEGEDAARCCFHYLKPGAYLRIAVPDGYFPSADYLKLVQVGVDGHKVLYNHELLATLLRRVGFDVKLLEYFDSNGVFHFEDWSAANGMIIRSKRYDERNASGELIYTSLIIDAFKPKNQSLGKRR